MIKESEISLVLEEALKYNGDFAEIFFEDTEETQISTLNGETQGVKSVRLHGAGIYILSGTDSIYVYSNDTSLKSLISLAGQASSLMRVKQNIKVNSAFENCRNIPVFEKYIKQNMYNEKIKRIIEAEKRMKSMGIDIPNTNMKYFDSDQRVCIANSEGTFVRDRRTTSRLRYDIAISDGSTNYSRWEDLYKVGDFSKFIENEEHINFGKDLVNRMNTTLHGRSISPCKVPVILDSGVSGTFFHECCGHMLEGCAIASKVSPFTDMMGEYVASEKVTLADDGTVEGAVGSSLYDDEGNKRQKNILIKNGVLSSYMNDRLSGRILGTSSNGCGRRQNYTYAPTSRMSNTYLLPGNDDDEDMIKEIDQGLFVKTVGGGVGGEQFAISVADAFWIENGKITYPVKGISLTGNGIELMKKIDRVGTSLGRFDGSFCGASSGLIPTTVNQPRMRISEIELG